MSKFKYTPYSTRRRKKKSNIRHIIISIVLILVIYLSIKWLWSRDTNSEMEQISEVKLTEIEAQPKAVEPVFEDVREPLQTTAINDKVRYVQNIEENQIAETDTAESYGSKDETITAVAVSEEDVSSYNEDIAQNEEAKKLVLEAYEDIKNNKVISARFKLNSALRMPLTEVQRINIKRKLSELSEIWLFSNQVEDGDTLCSYYKVKSGDLLSNIGKVNCVPWELLLKLNHMSRAENLRAGARIKIVKGPFHAIVNRDSFTLDLYLGQTFVKSYKVGLGKEGHNTPKGMWMVKNEKLISPNWTDPDTGKLYDATNPDYPLGKRWVGLKGLSGEAEGSFGFALHGTNEPESIGKRSSRGCIRLHDKDILEIYDLMMPNHSQVQVKD